MATPEEKAEIDDLHALFGHSDVPKGMFLKFEVSKMNRKIADKGREEKEERQRLLQLAVDASKSGKRRGKERDPNDAYWRAEELNNDYCCRDAEGGRR